MTDTTEIVREAVTIQLPVDVVFQFWRQLENLPLFMDHLKEVTKVGTFIYHWKAKAPLGTSAEWDAIITEEKVNKVIRWQSLEGSEVENAGSVWFTQIQREASQPPSTLLEVELSYKPPFGKIGAAIASLFGENPKQQVKDDLKKLKAYLERNNYTDIAV